MKIAVRYYTRSGNTQKLAEAIAEALGVSAKDVSVPLSGKADLLFLGSSVYAGGVDGAVRDFIESNRENIGALVNFSTAALVRSTYKQVKKLAAENGIDLAEEEFHCRGSFAMVHRGRPNSDDLENSAKFAKDIVKKYNV